MKSFLNIAFFTLAFGALAANADFRPFTQSEYDAAIAAKKPVVVDFHASWCPTCKKQAPILNEIVAMKGYENVVALKADYDKEKDLKKALKVTKQSTIVVFKDGKEVARKTGVTDKVELKKLIDMAM